MRAVLNLSDHVYVLNQGRIIAEGAPHEVACRKDVIEAYLGQHAAARLNAAALDGAA
jgi:branched-chain amino acid transport system ATP-binding protein